MLLIGDIHITTKYNDSILDTIKTYVDKFPHEKNIIFLGDYMYMFSYDRKALGHLFDLFLSLWESGKNVYILAGNHDWIGQQFVYAEGKKIADMLPQSHGNTLRFITSPEIHTIEGKEILFFPFSKHITIPEWVDRNDISPTIQGLLESKNNNERLSGEINMLLDAYIKKHPHLTIIHHYYLANTKFPGQQAIFHYRDIALSPDLLENESIRLISGHIHMPFAYKNYFCTGSIWYTSPLEIDHHKFLYQWEAESNLIHAQQVAINPYIVLSLPGENKLTEQHINTHKHALDELVKATFGGLWSVQTTLNDYPLAKTHITILTESAQYDTLSDHIDENLLNTAKERSLKKKSHHVTDMSFTLEIAQKNLKESLVDWKIIVNNLIMSRFGEDFEKYRTVLDELHILS